MFDVKNVYQHQHKKIKWPYDAKTVRLYGSFDNWEKYIEMEKDGDVFVCEVYLYPGKYEYKFLVDNEKWCYDMKKEVVNDNFGGKNNVIYVEDPNIVKLVHISDTHGLFYNPDDMPPADILIHSGDFCRKGTPEEYYEFNEWLGKLPYKYKIIVLGNHDIKYMIDVEKINPLVEAPKRLFNAIILSSEKITIMGIKIYGIQWQYFHDWNYDILDEFKNDIDKYSFDHIPTDINILVTHGPSYNNLDLVDFKINDTKINSGSKDMAHVISLVKPSLHLFGHIHESYGYKTSDYGTTFLNGSSVGRYPSELINQPHVIIINSKTFEYTICN